VKAVLVRFALALALIALGLSARPAFADAQPLARFAIVIGNDSPERGERGEQGEGESLRYADDDAIATHRLLRQAGVDSVLLVSLDADTRRLYPQLQPDGTPSERDLEGKFTAMLPKMRRAREQGLATELYLFYSGHGDVDAGEGYVVLEDGRLTRTKLYALLARSPATRNHVFVDACKSYFLAFDKGPGGRRESFTGSLGPSAPSHLDNTGFVLSTSSDRDSHEWSRYQAGILSHELRSALRGAADADGDGRITYAELGAFLSTANEAITNASFRPDFLVRPPEHDLREDVLTWSPAVGSVRLEGPELGHVYIETPTGERVLDAHPDGRRAVMLHVPDERPLFVRSNDGAAEHVILTSDPVTVASLDGVPDDATKGALHMAFARLFEAPFGLENVAEYVLEPPPSAEPEPMAGSSKRALKQAIALPAGAIAIGAALGGAATGLLALDRSLVGSGASEAEVAQRNIAVRDLDITSAILCGVAVVAGATWGWTRLSPNVSVSIQTAARRDPGVSLAVDGRF
jgi:hypothetical protein